MDVSVSGDNDRPAEMMRHQSAKNGECYNKVGLKGQIDSEGAAHQYYLQLCKRFPTLPTMPLVQIHLYSSKDSDAAAL